MRLSISTIFQHSVLWLSIWVLLYMCTSIPRSIILQVHFFKGNWLTYNQLVGNPPPRKQKMNPFLQVKSVRSVKSNNKREYRVLTSVFVSDAFFSPTCIHVENGHVNTKGLMLSVVTQYGSKLPADWATWGFLLEEDKWFSAGRECDAFSCFHLDE